MKTALKDLLHKNIGLPAAAEYYVTAILVIYAVFPVLNALRLAVFPGNPLWSGWRDYIFWASGFFLLIMLLWCFGSSKASFPFSPHLFRKNPAGCFLSAFILWAFVSTLVTGFVYESVIGSEKSRTGLICTFCYIVMFFMALLLQKKRLIHIFLKAFLGVGAAVSLYILIDYFAFSMQLDPAHKNLIFYNSNHLSYYLLVVCVFAECVFILSECLRVQLLCLGTALLSFGALMVADTLGCLIALLVTQGFLIVVFCLTGKMRFGRFVIAIAAGALWAELFLIIPNTAQGSFVLTSALKNLRALNLVRDSLPHLQTASDSLGSGRMKLWRQAIQCIKDKPVFGYGLAGMREQLNAATGNVNNTVHNEFLEYASNHGIPALVFYLGFVFSIFGRGLKHRRKLTDLQAISLCTAFAYLVSSFSGVTIFYTAPYLFIFLALGYYRNSGKV